MSDVAIQVCDLGKRYRLGGQARLDQTLRDTINEKIRALAHSLRRRGSQEAGVDPEEFWALRHVNFEVKHGEVMGIIGRNGAGKSTLLKILSQITDPTEGYAVVNGRVASLLEVGTGFHPELSGRENIYLNGSILGMTRREIKAKFDQIVDFSGVEKFLDTPIKRYSSGMTMRLAFSVAAHLEPEILIIDEVLAVGDAEFQKKCLGKMGEVAHSGRTVLFVSHNMNAVEELCQSVVFLKGGKLEAVGPDVREVIARHLFGDHPHHESAVWVNEGAEYENPWFKPTRLTLTLEDGRPLSQALSNNTDVWVQVEARVQELDPALTVGYAVYSESGHLLYWSYQTDRSESCWPRLHIGTNVLRSRFPKRLLNEGRYRIELIGGLHHRQWLFEPGIHAPAVALTIQGGLSDSPMWVVKRPGLIAPVLEWEVAA